MLPVTHTASNSTNRRTIRPRVPLIIAVATAVVAVGTILLRGGPAHRSLVAAVAHDATLSVPGTEPGQLLVSSWRQVDSLDMRTGAVGWSITGVDIYNGRIAGPMDGRLFLVSSDGHCRGYDDHSGRMLWDLPCPLDWPRNVAVDGHLLVASGKLLRSVNPATGRPIWSRTLRYAPEGMLRLPGGVAIANADATRLIDVRTGKDRWVIHLPNLAEVGASGATFTAIGLGGRVYSFDAATGKVRWMHVFRGISGLVSQPHVLLIMIVGGLLRYVDPVTGAELSGYADDAQWAAERSNALLTWQPGGRVTAWDMHSRTPKWSETLPEADGTAALSAAETTTAVVSTSCAFAIFDNATGRVVRRGRLVAPWRNAVASTGVGTPVAPLRPFQGASGDWYDVLTNGQVYRLQ